MKGTSNNHTDSFPFVLSFDSFWALHHFRQGGKTQHLYRACTTHNFEAIIPETTYCP